MIQTHAELTKPSIKRPLVAAGSLLVVVLVMTAMPGAAAAAASRSAFLTECTLAEVPRPVVTREARPKRESRDDFNRNGAERAAQAAELRAAMHRGAHVDSRWIGWITPFAALPFSALVHVDDARLALPPPSGSDRAG